MTNPLSLADLNTMDRETFVTVLGAVFEDSPWVAEGAWRAAEWDSINALHTDMMRVVRAATPAQQLNLLRAHPDLASKGLTQLSPASAAEQAGAGLDHLSDDEDDYFRTLNQAYRRRFGFPFIIAVRGLDKQAILEAMRTRLHHDAETERAAALAEVAKIAFLRLEILFGATSQSAAA